VNVNPSEIERIVREVLKSMAAPVLAPALANANQSIATTQPNSVSLRESVIGLEALRGIPAGATAIQVSSKAVVTPAARDWLRDRGVTIARGGSIATKPAVATASAVTAQPANTSVATSMPRLFIAGAVDWLPGLSKQLCPKQTKVADRVADDASVVRAIAVAIRSGHRSGLALVDAPHSTLWQSARDDLLRPAVVSQWSDLAEIFREVPVNLLIVPSKRWGVAGAANIARRFLVHVGSQS
jgi:hypothetical protein